MKRLHIVSTGKQTKGEFIEKIKNIHPYIDYVHLRERNWTAEEYINVIKSLVNIGVSKKKIIINDRVDIAVTQELTGVQLASHSIDIQEVSRFFPHLEIGCSVHNVKEAIQKEAQGADFLIFGHIFETKSKEGLPPRGLDQLLHITNSVSIPVIAIGGITPPNIPVVLQAGASGVAVLSGILLAEDSTSAAREYREILDKKRGESIAVTD